MPKARTDLTGAAGEYFVAAELARRGYVAILTLKNTQGLDILATDPKTGQMATIQVKTSRGTQRSWILRERPEADRRSQHFYVFVNLQTETEPPEYFVVPSRVVKHEISKSHRKWLAHTRLDGRKHKDTSMRKFTDKDGRFLNKWDSLWQKDAG